MTEPELVALATDADYDNLDLDSVAVTDLVRLRSIIDQIWARIDGDEELAIRFEWLHPLVDVAIRRRLPRQVASSRAVFESV
jgi:hypothetical protein